MGGVNRKTKSSVQEGYIPQWLPCGLAINRNGQTNQCCMTICDFKTTTQIEECYKEKTLKLACEILQTVDKEDPCVKETLKYSNWHDIRDEYLRKKYEKKSW